MVVYIDLIFLMNLLIDGSLLIVTAWMRKLKPRKWRITASAGIGALYVLMMFLPQLSFMYTFLTKSLFSIVMLWIAFGFGSLQHYLRNMGAFYMVNFVAAGGIIGIHYFLQSSSEIWNGMLYTSTGGIHFDIKIGAFFIIVVFFVVLFWFRSVQSSKKRQERLVSFLGEVKVSIGEASIACTGLLDTGNQLTDPLTRMPVMVMEASLWETYLPPSWAERLSSEGADNLIMELSEDDRFPWRERLRLVPYRGINKGTQFMLALKPDEVSVQMNGMESRCTRVLVGLDGGRLSAEGAYQAIIHPALTEESESIDKNSANAI
ncbi:stage II sporulation protein GA (sporulation sigma-E factor processing peptidase) [Paenibacillus shirakamiensis]|uniref:Stage II sporulation protein GA (Sporulation sigma-E factor processing peptidase) n=1 Tax=Paenibacillus shirakamiensis TaxID=1265935 RepID=A0ABS4JC30_9BACL|nr:sigma-E processing peptidase SpoIIGA [Paenibacillus shirakamiensis]MBP1999230.1 stage II sporulation protein GA (sporulation sigma-E factor processing peptidase) [Paenibacillus shirakamiensis]